MSKTSDSPYVKAILHGRTMSDVSTICPAESHWHLVFLDLDRLPEDFNDYETVGGMFMARLERILTF